MLGTLCFLLNMESAFIGPFVTLIFLLIHLYLVNFKSRDVKVILIAIACGFILDSSFSLLGLIVMYQGGFLSSYHLSPLWILSMWAGFSLSMMYTLEVIKIIIFCQHSWFCGWTIILQRWSRY